MLNNYIKIKKAAQPIKSFSGSPGGRFFKRAPLAAGGILILLFIIPMIIQASGQYRLLSWKGEVKIMKGGKFISLTGQTKISLEKGDGIWIANGAEVKLQFPGGNQKVCSGPCFTKIETLEKAREGPSTIVNLIKSMGIEELLSRKKEDTLGGTRAGSERLYKKIKKAIGEMEEPLLEAGKEKDMKEVLVDIEARFDAATMETQVLIKARVYKHFNMDKQASMTVFNYYEKIRSLESKDIERNFIEDFLLNEFLPIVITFNLEDPDFITFSSNFELWWAVFFYDGKELKEIMKTIDTSLDRQVTFRINRGNIRSKPNNSPYLFIIAGYNSSELEKLDNMETAKKELLGKEIPAAMSGKVEGIGNVFIKIRLK